MYVSHKYNILCIYVYIQCICVYIYIYTMYMYTYKWPSFDFKMKIGTLPKRNTAPENWPSQKEISIPTIHFQVLR